jgi:hypothetical protein
VLPKVLGCSQTVVIIGDKVHGKRTIPSQGQPVAQPAVSGSEIQNPSAFKSKILLEHMPHQVIVAMRSDFPLLTVSSGNVLIRKA